MSDEKNFFDMTPKQSLVMGLIGGVAIISVIGLVITLLGGLPGGGNNENVNTNTNYNVNTNTDTPPSPTPTNADVSKLLPLIEDSYSQGPENAKVTLIEVSDFQCPYCERHAPTMDQIMDVYAGKVRRVWINFPLTSIHPYAMKAAGAAECAGEQGKFWEMHDEIFANQSAITVDDLKGYAQDLGLKTSQFNSCLDGDKYSSKIQQQMTAAQAAGVSGTPGTFVNGQLVKGAYPFDTFKQLIDAELAK